MYIEWKDGNWSIGNLNTPIYEINQVLLYRGVEARISAIDYDTETRQIIYFIKIDKHCFSVSEDDLMRVSNV